MVDAPTADSGLRFIPTQAQHFQLNNQGGIDMADDRKQNLGQQGGMHEGQRGSSQQAPGRGPQDDRSAGERGQQKGGEDRERRGGFDPSRGGDGGSYKEGGQNEQNRR